MLRCYLNTVELTLGEISSVLQIRTAQLAFTNFQAEAVND